MGTDTIGYVIDHPTKVTTFLNIATKKVFTCRLLSDGYNNKQSQLLVTCTPSSCRSKQYVYGADASVVAVAVVIVDVSVFFEFDDDDDESCKKSFFTRSE